MKTISRMAAGIAVAAAGILPAAAQDVAEGQWINLFDGESTFGFTAFGDVAWGVEDGALKGSNGNGGWLAHNAVFQDFELSARIRLEGAGSFGLAVRAAYDGHTSENGAGVVSVKHEDRKESSEHTITIRAAGNDVSATLDGQPVEGFSTSARRGHIGILYGRYHASRGARGPEVSVQELKLRPLNLKSIFNGKDLSGWNIIPERKSEFSVVDGALNIVNGNGQIETDEVWRDFTLQLDIISNGEHLNSGVFFRTPKGVFWKGYESQVRNQWVGDDRGKPVDFGTGGVYGVQEARKVVSSDHEWFTKTVVASGNHVAVWINGYQVSDFFDTRPVNADADAKNGYVPTAGTINLQGHDPTTNLSFKNINVQSYDE
jgi:hypothetical protein